MCCKINLFCWGGQARGGSASNWQQPWGPEQLPIQPMDLLQGRHPHHSCRAHPDPSLPPALSRHPHKQFPYYDITTPSSYPANSPPDAIPETKQPSPVSSPSLTLHPHYAFPPSSPSSYSAAQGWCQAAAPAHAAPCCPSRVKRPPLMPWCRSQTDRPVPYMVAIL